MSRILIICFTLLALPAHALQHYSYEVLETQPQSRHYFVQGLQIIDDYLYIGTGLYGQSAVMRYHLADGTLDAQRPLNPQFFGEGITVLDGLLYQLTWKRRMLLVYRASDLTPQKWYQIPGEGWGITHNGTSLIYSDGSDKLHFVSPVTGNITHSVAVTDSGQPLIRINELEWIDGKVWANVWPTNRIVIIDPSSGVVTGSIDMTGILPAEQRQPGTDVLNGIAVNPANGDIWVTGKRWPSRYRIKLVPVDKPVVQPPTAPVTQTRTPSLEPSTTQDTKLKTAPTTP